MRFQTVSILTVGFLSNYLAYCQRPVFPLIPLYGPSPFKPSGLNVEYRNPDDYNPVRRRPEQVEDVPEEQQSQATNDREKGRFVQSDGVKISCFKHAECYPYREPQQWCHLANGEFWIDKGCFCDKIEGACVIKRRNPQEIQWTYCSPKANWVCPQEQHY